MAENWLKPIILETFTKRSPKTERTPTKAETAGAAAPAAKAETGGNKVRAEKPREMKSTQRAPSQPENYCTYS